MDARLQEMLDHYEITRVLSEYCHGCDRMDQALMASVYAQNSWDDHGVNKCPGPEFAQRTMTMMAAITESVSHLMGQSLIKIRGDEAGAETYFLAVVKASDEAGAEIIKQLGGRYVDELVREDGRWRIKKRICVRDWSITLHGKDWLAGQQFVDGQRSQLDPSQAALGMQHSGWNSPTGSAPHS